MSAIAPIALSIAGYDPCGGAGLLADIKTMEQHGVYGMGVMTANTIQDEDKVHAVEWLPEVNIIRQLEILVSKYDITYVKIGIVESVKVLCKIIDILKHKNKEVKIIWDPVFRSTSGYALLSGYSNVEDLLHGIYLITPNYNEYIELFDGELHLLKSSAYCNILLKGGHNPTHPGVDTLYTNRQRIALYPCNQTAKVYEKHGSGCVLASSITANLTLGNSLHAACEKAKAYTLNFLCSHPSRLGWHHQTTKV